jgi:hypothetical protein
MTGNKIPYSIYDLAKIWKLRWAKIMLLIFEGKLKVIIVHEDCVKRYDKFTDIPDNVRINLQIVTRNHVPKKTYNLIMSTWDKVFIDVEEAERFLADHPEIANRANPETESPRKIDHLLQAFVAMTMECYGYDPTKGRNTATNDIQKALDEHGVKLSENTIRNYLKSGYELLDRFQELKA